MTNPSDPRDPHIIDWLREHRAPNEPTFSADTGWSRFVVEHDLRGRRSTYRILPRTVWRIAAALIIAAAGVGVWRFAAGTGASRHLTEQVAANGQHRTINLADGSTVTLNGGSRLRYDAGTTDGSRDVYLDGEAFFAVRHDASRPFRVHAKDGTIEDVGTQFNVRAYASQAGVQVAVAEGAVTLASASTRAPLTLRAGDVAVLESSGVIRRVSGESVDRYVGWMRGELVLDQLSLRDAAAELERAYGVHVVIGDSALARRTVAARFHGERVQQVLDAIVVALDASYEQHDSTFVIRPRTVK